jgi:chromate reductase
MNAAITVAAFAGSLRRQSYNRMLLDAAAGLAPENVRISKLDVSDVPLYNMDLDNEQPPAPVKRIRDAIRAADALLIVTPEHNYTMSGVTKTVIEWASRPPENSSLDGKPVAVMGASPSGFGTVRAQHHVRQAAVESGMLIMQDPELRVSDAEEKFDDAGRLVDDRLRHQIKAFLAALHQWTLRMKA